LPAASVPDCTPLFESIRDLLAETARGPAKMGFEDLSDVHTRRHAQRVQHDIDRRTVFEERHVFLRQNARDNTLVPVTTGHLVARLQLALHRDEHLDHLQHARRQIITALQLFNDDLRTSR
jgi:hypothetical protein